MSLLIKKEEPWVILPESRYDITDRKIDTFMDDDFSLYLRVKAFPETMEYNEEGFAFARSGKHSGLSFYKVKGNDGIDIVTLMWTYWFTDDTFTQFHYTLSNEEVNDFIEVVVLNDDTNSKTFTVYVNSKLIDTKQYIEKEKQSYRFGEMGGGGFYQFGNGNFQVPDIAMYCECEFDMCFLLKGLYNLNAIQNIANTYEENLIEFLEDLKMFHPETSYKKDMAFFLDFKQQNRYKVWELTHNGNYLSKATLENIYF